MAEGLRTKLKGYFLNNMIPHQGQFAELIDAQLNEDDGIYKRRNEPLSIAAESGSGEILRLYKRTEVDPLDVNTPPEWTLRLDQTEEGTTALGFADASGTPRCSLSAGGRLIVRSIVANGGVDAPLSRLDVENNFTATIRAADLEFGHSDRRGEPGIALVDGRDSLIINFDSAWPQTEVQSKLIAGRGKGNGYGAEIHGHLEVHGGGLVVDDDVEILGKLKLPNSQFELQRGFSSAIAVGRHLLQSTTIGDTRAIVLCAKVSVSSDNGGPPNEVILVHDGEELARKTVLTSTATTISAVAALGGTVELFLDCKTGGIQWNIECYFTGFWL